MSRLLVLGSAAMLAAGVTAPAVAQETAAAEGGLQEIVVTAERREASLQSVPVAVSALNAETLENRQITESRDLMRFVPSLKMNNNITTPSNLSPSLRGSTIQDASLIVAESPFGIYVDDVYIGRLNANNTTLADIERVEVLRGPQGTLYGRNTLAGAVKYITRTPGEDSWLKASVGAGNWDQYLASFSAGGQLTDAWAASFAGQYNSKDNQFDNIVTGEEKGRERNYATRAKLRFTGSENLDVVLSGSYVKSEGDSLQLQHATTPTRGTDQNPVGRQVFTTDDLVPTGGWYTVSTPNVPRSPAPIASQPYNKGEQIIASLNASYDFGGVTLRSITAYVNTRDEFTTDYSGIGLIVGSNDADIDQYSQEFQLQGNLFGDRLSYIAGAYFLREEGEQMFSWQFITPTSSSLIEAETDSVSLFGQVDFQITDALKATAGLRWVEDDKTFDIAFQRLPSALPIPGLGPAIDAVSLENTYEEWTPKFGLDYTIEPGDTIDSMLLYASMARGFKSGGYNGINIFDLAIARTPYAPEKNWTYEIGVKTDLFSKLRVNAAYFYNDIEDLQLNATVAGGTAFPVQNAGKATIQGLELEVTFAPINGLNLFVNAALMDGNLYELNPTSAPAQAPGKYAGAGSDTPQVPDYAFTVGADYRFPTSFGDLTFGADWYRTDDYVTSATNDFIVKAYDRLSAFAAVGIGESLEVRLSAKNLTDEETVTSGSRALGGFILLPRREVMLSLNYDLN